MENITFFSKKKLKNFKLESSNMKKERKFYLISQLRSPSPLNENLFLILKILIFLMYVILCMNIWLHFHFYFHLILTQQTEPYINFKKIKKNQNMAKERKKIEKKKRGARRVGIERVEETVHRREEDVKNRERKQKKGERRKRKGER